MTKITRSEFCSDADYAAYLRAHESDNVRVFRGSVITGSPPAMLSPPTESQGSHAVFLRQGGSDTLRLHSPLRLSALARGLPTKFSGVAYSGGLVPQLQAVIDLSTTRYNQRMPLLNSHRTADIVGVIEQADHQTGAMIVAGRLFSDMPGSSAERIAELAYRDAPFEMSVAIYDYTLEKVELGRTVTVNGRPFAGPVAVLRNGHVREASIVTLGADPETSASFQ